MSGAMTNAEKQAICDMWNSGMNAMDIAALTKRTDTTVRSYLRKVGIFQPGRHRKRTANMEMLNASQTNAVCWDCRKATNDALCSWVAEFELPQGAQCIEYESAQPGVGCLCRIVKCPDFEED